MDLSLLDTHEEKIWSRSILGLPALGADSDKVGSESVKLWFRLASAAAKRNLISVDGETHGKLAWERSSAGSWGLQAMLHLLREMRRCGIEPEMTAWV